MTSSAQPLNHDARTPSFRTAFLGFVGSLAFVTTAMVLLGSMSA
ncbi:MAG TPA: hypothetical protein VHL98_13455 [Microvirga sp.]|nr:hypothetical protein [Microvirga sp.]